MDDSQNLRSQEALTLAADAAALLLASGAETSRAQETAEILFRAFGTGELQAYVLTNGVIAVPLEHSLPGGVRNVPNSSVNLTRVAAVNELSRQIAAGGLTLDEAEAQLARAQRIPFPNDWVQLVAGLSGAFCFAMIFGGTLRAGLAAAVAGLAANGYLLLCERLNLPGGFRKITTASLITLVCLPLCHLLGTEASHAIIGTLMILTPGIAFTMGIRDFVQGDYLSGTIRMIDALLVAACIAIGTGFVLLCYSLLTGVNIV